MSLGAFYACVTLLADIVSTLSVNAYRKNGVTATKTLVDPQPTLLVNSPFPGLTWFEWLWMFMESLAVTGNGFGYATDFGPDGRPIGIMPVHPDCVHIEQPEESGTSWTQPAYKFNGVRVAADRVVHIKRYPIAGRAWGMSPVQKAAAAVGLGLAAERYGLRYFRDSANPSGILHTDQELTVEQSKRAMKSWIQSHQGRRLPAVMSGGLKWQSVTLTPNESQFLETRQFQRSDIAMWFRIPPHMIGDTNKSTTWGSGIENMTLGFVKYTLMPWLVCIEQVLSALLPRGQFAKFNIDDLMRGDVLARWQAYRIGRDSGVYSANEIREKEDLQPLEGEQYDLHLQPSNFVPLGTDPALIAGGGGSGGTTFGDHTPNPPDHQKNEYQPAEQADGEDEEEV